MSPSRAATIACLALLCACGRIGFDAIASEDGGLDGATEDSSTGDGGEGDGTVGDAAPDANTDSSIPPGESSDGMTGMVKTYGFLGADQGYDVAVGRDGTVYLTGTFQGNVSFGGPSVAGVGGTVDAFVAAFDADGGASWAVDIGSDDNDRAQAIAVDAMNRVYVCGLFASTADFDGAMETAVGMWDVFIAAYEEATLQWVRAVGGAGADFCYDVDVDPAGNVLVAGYYEGAVDFGDGPLTAYGDRDAFVAKYTRDGGLLWAWGGGTPGSDSGQGVAATSSGNVVFTGNTGGSPLAFGTGTLDTGGGAFLIELTPDGVVERTTGLPLVAAWEVDVHRPTGRRVLAARLQGSVDLGTGMIPAPSGSNDGLVLSYRADQTLEWYAAFGGALSDIGLGIAIDGAGNSYMIGLGGADIDFGDGLVTGNGDQDIFVVSHDPSGAVRWGRLFGGAVQDRGYAAAISQAGSLYITGRYEGDASFGDGMVTAGFGGDDIFLVRLD